MTTVGIEETCIRCAAPIPEGSRFCPVCGVGQEIGIRPKCVWVASFGFGFLAAVVAAVVTVLTGDGWAEIAGDPNVAWGQYLEVSVFTAAALGALSALFAALVVLARAGYWRTALITGLGGTVIESAAIVSVVVLHA